MVERSCVVVDVSLKQAMVSGSLEAIASSLQDFWTAWEVLDGA